MRTIAVYNNKGGVGNTTLSAHMVYAADAAGLRTPHPGGALVGTFGPEATLLSRCSR